MTVETVDLSSAMGNLLQQSHGGTLLGILAKALAQVMEAEVSAQRVRLALQGAWPRWPPLPRRVLRLLWVR